MAVAVISSFIQQCDSNGVPLNAGTIDVYSAGTTTPLSLYSNTALSVAATNPITLDSSGRHAITYIATASYKLVLKNSAGTTIYTRDNIDPGVAIGSGALPIANGGTAGTTEAAARTNLGAASATDMSTAQSDISNLNTWAGYLLTTITRIAFGTTAQEPAASVRGFRFDMTTGFLRFCTGAAWFNLPRSGQIQASDFLTGNAVICLKRSRTTLTAQQTFASTIPADSTIPQIGEGTEVTGFNVSFTPLNASSSTRVTVNLQVYLAGGSIGTFALFKDSAASAVSAVVVQGDGAASSEIPVRLTYEFSPGATTAITFAVRGGTNTGSDMKLNGNTATLGGVRITELIIEEWLSP